jgi:hypothetical protein
MSKSRANKAFSWLSLKHIGFFLINIIVDLEKNTIFCIWVEKNCVKNGGAFNLRRFRVCASNLPHIFFIPAYRM